MKEKKESAKRIVFTILGILLLICSVMIVGFAIFVFEDTSNHDNSITTGTNPEGTLSFAYNENSNGVELMNAIPIDDVTGKKLTNSDKAKGINQGYFDFSIRASGTSAGKIKYQIYATLENDSNMDTKYIKVYLTDDKNNPYRGYDSDVPVFSSLDKYSSQKNSKILYSDEINVKEDVIKRFRLRLWVAKDYSDGATSKTFKIKVNVRATA